MKARPLSPALANDARLIAQCLLQRSETESPGVVEMPWTYALLLVRYVLTVSPAKKKRKNP